MRTDFFFLNMRCYTVLSTLGLLMIGLLTNSVLETIIIITIFYLCQTNGGGFHATTHLRCFLTMTLGLLIGLMFVRLPIFRSVIPYTCFLSFLILLARPLQLHPNKEYLLENSRLLRIRSYCVTLSIAIVIVIIRFWGENNIFYAAAVAICLSAVSRLFAVKHSSVTF